MALGPSCCGGRAAVRIDERRSLLWSRCCQQVRTPQMAFMQVTAVSTSVQWTNMLNEERAVAD